MIAKLYSIRDCKSCYGLPYCQINDGVACRDFQQRIAGQSDVAMPFSSDFSLYCVGSFDDETGKLTMFEPQFVMSGEDVIKP